jgi:hypothetical protein
MFKNRSIQVKFVKDAEDASVVEDTKNPIVNEDTAAIAKDIITPWYCGRRCQRAIITFKTLSEMA